MKLDYQGDELELFAEVLNWKRYFCEIVRPFVVGRVLEVGAGKGVNTELLMPADFVGEWTCLEPDPGLCEEIDGLPHTNTRVINGTLHDIDESERFDCVLYIDVLEHIEDDARELEMAARKLDLDGHVVVVSPAHQALYSPFDRHVGHFRRYSKKRMVEILPADCAMSKLVYIDSAGLLLSLGNKIMLSRSLPTRRQLHVWDKFFVPVSRRVDRILGQRIGKSIVAAMKKTTA